MSSPITTIRLAPIGAADEPFLFKVYASTRAEELAPTGWSEDAKTAFLQQQFTAQHEHYQTYYEGADFLLILLEQVPIGRLYVKRGKDEIRVMDIALLPEYRNLGIGSALLGELLNEGAASDKPVRIHVEKFNPALRLYERLGFYVIEDKGVYWFMEWSPNMASQIQKGE